MSLAVVGADFSTGKGPTRRFEIAMCRPGEPIILKREPRNPHDERAIAVYSARDIQIGYIRAEQAAWISQRIDELTAAFQRPDSWGAVIRVTFDGSAPVLPPETVKAKSTASSRQWLPGDEDPWPPPSPPDEFSDG